ncbi:ubiquinol-cytochrome C reductase complex subunit oxen [Tachypleus tridentatus]|uniref:ubiquinol-cytochrome C reductase complex subunit oxen n=1 Tax=Tachypleus tridentatus TaxID=6853 RepID=UPI003FD3A5FD
MAGFVARVYHTIFRRSSSYALAVIGGVFFFERGFDMLADTVFDNINKGKLWKEIKVNYEQK